MNSKNIKKDSKEYKFEQVFLYVLSKVGGKPNVGETVLHKLMYFIDFDYFEKYEEQLTGIKYKKNHHGPTFDSSLIDKMKQKDLIECVKGNYGSYKQKKYLAKQEPDLDVLSAKEIKHIDEVLDKHSNKTAGQIEEYSHGDIPWVIAKEKENIAYQSVFYRDDNYSVRDYDLDDPL